MSAWNAQDPDFSSRVHKSFGAQNVMSLIGATLAGVEPGICSIRLPFRDDLCQQNGFFHAGITSTIADSAGGYAGYSLMPADSNVLTVEFKVTLLRPAAGEELVARGEVIRAGKNLTFTEVQVFALKDGEKRVCARMSQTLACITNH